MGKKESLKEIRQRRKELREKELELKAELDANKQERQDAQKEVKENKELFEKARKAHSDNMKKLNKIHLCKSAVKNFDEFKSVSVDLLLSCDNLSKSLNEYTDSLVKLKDFGG